MFIVVMMKISSNNVVLLKIESQLLLWSLSVYLPHETDITLRMFDNLNHVLDPPSLISSSC